VREIRTPWFDEAGDGNVTDKVRAPLLDPTDEAGDGNVVEKMRAPFLDPTLGEEVAVMPPPYLNPHT